MGRLRSIGVKAPFSLGEVAVGVDETSKERRSLDRVIEYLESRPQRIRWYEERSVRAGDWVQFDVLMNYAVVEVSERHLPIASGESRVVVFWQPDTELEEWPVRPLLIGHPAGLVDDRPDLAALGGYKSTSDLLPRILPAVLENGKRLRRNSIFTFELAELEIELDVNIESVAMRYAGYGRVVANLSSENTSCPPALEDYRYVIVSPLYVERPVEAARH